VGIGRHWTLVLAADSAARPAPAQGRWGHWIKATLKPVGEVSRQVPGEAWAALVAFVVMELTPGRPAQEIVGQLVSCLSR